MTMPAAKLTVITLGVRDVPASGRFYEKLGFTRKVRATGDEVVFLDAGGLLLALWDWNKLADDSVVDVEPRPQTFRGMTLAWNCATPAEVDEVFAKAVAVGGKVLREPSKTDYGGHRGYFSDPDGHVWEVVYSPTFSLDSSGRLIAPD
jgi:predicted lactoylglutathione lyase